MSPILTVSSQAHDLEYILENFVYIRVPVMVMLRQIAQGIH